MRGFFLDDIQRMSSPAPRVLINADDFGLHRDIDRGILDCVERGRVHSVSFSPIGNSIDWKKLIELQKAGTLIGLHVTLVGEPWATDGRIVPGWKNLVRALLLPGVATRSAVSAEIERQFTICSEHGIDPSTLAHVDSHQHVHVFNHIWQPVLRLVRAHRIPRVRIPKCANLYAIKKNLGGAALQWIARRRQSDVASFLPCLGLAQAGHNTAAIFADELAHTPPQPIELVVHPGINTPKLESRYHDWRFDWSGEKDALLSQHFSDSLAAAGFQLF